MATALPVPLEFRLPDGWTPASPDDVGAPGVAFIALHPESRDERMANFTANITIAGKPYGPEITLTQLADDSVARLETAALVQVADRTEAGTDDVPALSQVLRVTTQRDGETHQLMQCQVYLDLQDQADEAKRAVIELGLTATANQIESLVGDFQSFVRTVAPRQPEPGEQ
ncbi:MAG: hypothetical protein GEU86_08880 [Actinophytocola sp.]|nr:hypothetical protein [Actinophytocola sp.]